MLAGGWRLPLEAAFLAMVEGDEAAQPCTVELRVSIKSPTDFARPSALAGSLRLV